MGTWTIMQMQRSLRPQFQELTMNLWRPVHLLRIRGLDTEV